MAGSVISQRDLIRCMSFNIWVERARGRQRWEARRERVASIVRFHRPDVLGVQEATARMVGDVARALPEHDWSGVGRDDGDQSGEFSAVFHRKERFERVESDTFWLSTEETKPGRGWDAALPRVVTWVRLRERTTGRELFCFNTHFDHLGRQARIESAHLLRRKIASIAGEAPVVLMGDFNCGVLSKPYKILTEQGLGDAARISQHPPHGPRKTWRGLSGLFGSTIDFIFVRGAITVLQYAVLSDEWDRRVASDHRPVVADIHLDS